MVASMLTSFTAVMDGIFGVVELDQRPSPEVCKLVLVCTTGALQKKHVIASLLQVSSSTHIEPIVSEATFRFPTAEFYTDVVREATVVELDGPRYGKLLAGIFKGIATEVDPQASEDVLLLSIMRLSKRFSGGPQDTRTRSDKYRKPTNAVSKVSSAKSVSTETSSCCTPRDEDAPTRSERYQFQDEDEVYDV
eukprot:SRR837773.22256.p1 GENE.SRR837773.22256~~SRR837773.22256.p1  ORF type:complete len:213 (-),score=21.49 SRR837773.22256:35-613(-)